MTPQDHAGKYWEVNGCRVRGPADRLNDDYRTRCRGKDFANTDLTAFSLAYAELDGSDFENANLTRVDLHNASITGSHFVGANMSLAILTKAHLDGCDMRSVNLTRARLDYATLVTTVLTDSTLDGADFSHAKLGNSNLARASLVRADLVDTDLSGADLRGADLRMVNAVEARFDGANLSGTRFEGAILNETSFKNTLLAPRKGSTINTNGMPLDLTKFRYLENKFYFASGPKMKDNPSLHGPKELPGITFALCEYLGHAADPAATYPEGEVSFVEHQPITVLQPPARGTVDTDVILKFSYAVAREEIITVTQVVNIAA